MNELDADVVVVVEGPDRTEELQLLFDDLVAGEWQAHIQKTKGSQQNIGIAIRTDTRKLGLSDMQTFDEFTLDVEDDSIPEIYTFERRPLYIELSDLRNCRFRIVGLHLKSKAI
ncbi:MAG: hypothetical protein QNJ22_01650 [Desulfosarcinaceae bacterium]|nr:hypothetical protein [Desulfosarcinaceae bacterium]